MVQNDCMITWVAHLYRTVMHHLDDSSYDTRRELNDSTGDGNSSEILRSYTGFKHNHKPVNLHYVFSSFTIAGKCDNGLPQCDPTVVSG
jgi:hypothetical protein